LIIAGFRPQELGGHQASRYVIARVAIIVAERKCAATFDLIRRYPLGLQGRLNQ
jgi:hypothetical protein